MPEGHTVHRQALSTRSASPVATWPSPARRAASSTGAALLNGRRLESTRGVRQAPVPDLRRRPTAARAPRPDRQVGSSARRRRRTRWGPCGCGWSADESYADLRGAIAVEVWTPDDRSPAARTARSGPVARATRRRASPGGASRRSRVRDRHPADGPDRARGRRQRLPRGGALPGAHRPAPGRPRRHRARSGWRCGATSSR